MALFKIYRGNSAELSRVPKIDGHAYFCPDDGSFWVDYMDESFILHRKQINANEAKTVKGFDDFKQQLIKELEKKQNTLIAGKNVTIKDDIISVDISDVGYSKEEIEEFIRAIAITTESDPTVPDWAKSKTKPSYTAEEVGALPANTQIPSSLSELASDENHKTVTEKEKESWNLKSNFSGKYEDLKNKPEIPNPTTVQINGESITEDGIANIPLASSKMLGVIKMGAGGGLWMDSIGSVYIHAAVKDEIKNKVTSYKPISPNTLDYAVKIGMTTNTETWTEEEKTAARDLIGAVPKITEAARVYITDTNGNQSSYPWALGTVPNSIPRRSSKGQVSTADPTETGHATNKRYVDNLFNGANKAVSFINYSSMIASLNTLTNTSYNVGQNIMIVTLQVPDLWVSEIVENSVSYTYISDTDFINTLNENGYVQVGYYKLSALETQKVDLTDYAKVSNLENKLDKVTEVERYSAYIVYKDGTQGVYPMSADYMANAIALYNAGGRLTCSTPTADSNTANKKYVDDALLNKLDKTDTANILYGTNHLKETKLWKPATSATISRDGNIPVYYRQTANTGDENNKPSGILLTNTPLLPYQCANKLYADTKSALFKHVAILTIPFTLEGDIEPYYAIIKLYSLRDNKELTTLNDYLPSQQEGWRNPQFDYGTVDDASNISASGPILLTNIGISWNDIVDGITKYNIEVEASGVYHSYESLSTSDIEFTSYVEG